MRLWRYAGYGKMPAMAKCRLWQNASAKLRNFLIPLLLEAVHETGTMMLEYVRNGAMFGRSTQWLAARCLDFVPDGGAMP